MQISNKHYHGKPCGRCKQTLRLKSNYSCVNCRKNYYQQNKCKVSDYNRSYYSQNRDTLLSRQCDYYSQNREKKSAYDRGWRIKYYALNRDRKADYQRQYLRQNPGKVKIRNIRRRTKKKAVLSAPYTHRQLKQRFELFGNQCVYCLSRDRITVDHFIPLSLGGADILRNLVPACRSCNSSKQDKEPLQWMKSKGFSETYIVTLIELMLES